MPGGYQKMSETAPAILALDLGGTRIRAARLDDQLNVVARSETLTLAHEGRDAVLERITTQLRSVAPTDNHTIGGIGISAPGPLNPATGVIVDAENLPGFVDLPLTDILSAEFGVTAYLNNDANVAALAEALRGAAVGYRHVVYMTLSTGIGGGIISDGRLLLGADGMAAEIGFMLLRSKSGVGNLQDEASGPAMTHRARRRIETGTSSQIAALVKGDLSRINPAVIGQAAQMDDSLAQEIITETGRVIGMGAANLLHLFNPQILVLGGGVSNLGEQIFAPIRQSIQQHCIPAYWQNLRIEPAALGEDVGLVGAGALVITEGGCADIGAAGDKLRLQH